MTARTNTRVQFVVGLSVGFALSLLSGCVIAERCPYAVPIEAGVFSVVGSSAVGPGQDEVPDLVGADFVIRDPESEDGSLVEITYQHTGEQTVLRFGARGGSN